MSISWHLEQQYVIQPCPFPCRLALDMIPQPQAAIHIRSNLGALLLGAGRIQDALHEFDTALQQGKDLGQRKQVLSGILFNKAKALTAVGSIHPADEAYEAAAAAAYGYQVATYGKALAAMHSPSMKLIPNASMVRHPAMY